VGTELSAAATLDLWQAVEGRDPIERSLALAAVSGRDPDELAALPIGRRDALLLELHAGEALEATAACPACGEQAEFAVDTRELLARGREASEPAPVESPIEPIGWRSPDSRDVAAAAAAGDAEAAERVLLERCAGSADLPAEARAAVVRAMAEADPLAEVLVDVSCPACGEGFVADVDVAGFVWAELRARARRLLREVAVLARAYGWTESEALALGDRRRAAYLEFVEAVA
jgi:hypothetical protein